MARMIRKQISLTPATNAALKRAARLRGISEAAVIRERLGADGEPSFSLPERDPKKIARFLTRLRAVRKEAARRRDNGWRVIRDELYDDD